MRCKICLYQAPAGGVGHRSRCCPLNQVECRHQLPDEDPFFLEGPCTQVYCVHNQHCGRCHQIGHTAYTLRLTSTRWRVTSDGRAVPASGHALPPLDARDFMCPLSSDWHVRCLLENIQDLAL